MKIFRNISYFRIDRRTLFFSFLSGVLLFLSFPKFGTGLLAWIALVPLFYALRTQSPYGAFLTGLITGMIYNVGVLYWVIFVVVNYGYLPYAAGFGVMLLLAFYTSLYVAVFSTVLVLFRQRGVREIMIAPFLWTILEYGKSVFMTGFPWENLAYSQHGFLSLIQIADIAGIYGISFVIVCINCIFHDCLIMQERKKVLAEALGGFLLLAACIAYGHYSMAKTMENEAAAEKLRIALVQGNIDQSVKWDSLYRQETLDIYRKLSLQTEAFNPDLIIWPETALPFFFQDIDENHREVLEIVRHHRAYFLFGSPSYESVDEVYYLLNSAYVVSPEGKIAGRYDKNQLVPFGEYVPCRSLFFFLEKLVVGVGDFVAGKNLEPVSMGDKRIGVLICYEGIFPGISREYRRNGADLFVSITNDAWFGRSSAPWQHLTMTAFRAIENRVYIARAANTGVSAIIAPTGEIVELTNLFERNVLSGTVGFCDQKTMYTRYGDIFVFVCCLILLGSAYISFIRRKIT